MSAAQDIELQDVCDRRSSGFAAPYGSAAFSVLDLFSGGIRMTIATKSPKILEQTYDKTKSP